MKSYHLTLTPLLTVMVFAFTAVIASAQTNITFQVNLSYEIEQGIFDTEEHTVQLLGNTHPLSPSRTIEMEQDGDDPSLYIAQVSFSGISVGSNIQYSFRLDLGDRFMSEDIPRSFRMPETSTELDALYFNAYAW
ncbi:MAG: hypothetical protein JJU46_03150 [Balneolaceae bacterium]|nr:hypothetical protein [Balneolaceae bacterium]MCH8547817.1 hypothetical protein [Balneolaceae bacterium]